MIYNFLPISMLFILAGCDSRKQSITMVVPIGYKGLITVSQDKQNGLTVPSGVPVELSTTSIGSIKLKSLEIFFQWHELHFKYDNNDVIPVGQTSDIRPGDLRIFAFQLGASTAKNANGHTITYFIGTKSELDVQLRKSHPTQ